jgi:hypothetical protein
MMCAAAAATAERRDAMLWKPDWEQARQHHLAWWRGKSLCLWLTAPRAAPAAVLPEPAPPADLLARWTDPVYRVDAAESRMSRTHYLADAFPYFDGYIGPGSTNILLGSTPRFARDTVWYEPCIADPDAYGAIRFDDGPANRWWRVQTDLLREARRRCAGRYLLGPPDLVENLDVLAALRDTQPLLTDLLERPEWVKARLEEINRAYFAIFDRLFDLVRDGHGGNAFCFNLYGDGKTAKVQCDIACMLSPAMFREFVVGPLAEQCRYLDYSMFHLDGEDALPHLDALLAIEDLDAIEWTPLGASGRVAGRPTGGSPHWYPLYRRIKAAGKAVQAVQVKVDEVVPLIEAVGPDGLFVEVSAPDEASAFRLAERTRQYYRD